MPVYEAQCPNCKGYQDYYQTVANCLDTPECCGVKMDKVIRTAPMGIVDIPAYVSPVSGQLINSRTARREDLIRNNCREWEGMEQETKVAQNRAKEEEKQADKALEEAVVAAYHSLPADTKKSLESA